MPDWLVQFLPVWEEALKCIVAGATLTALWRAYCHPRKLPRRVVATAAVVITFVIAVPVVWVRSRDPAETFANALLIGAASPAVWEVLLAAARKWAPWLASALGEKRCWKRRDKEVWSHTQRRRAMFEDTDIDRLNRDDLERWREGCAKRGDLGDD